MKGFQTWLFARHSSLAFQVCLAPGASVSFYSPVIGRHNIFPRNKHQGVWAPHAGETQEQHQELLQFCRDFKFERMGAFAYSEEDGTPAGSFPDQVPPTRAALIIRPLLIGLTAHSSAHALA